MVRNETPETIHAQRNMGGHCARRGGAHLTKEIQRSWEVYVWDRRHVLRVVLRFTPLHTCTQPLLFSLLSSYSSFSFFSSFFSFVSSLPSLLSPLSSPLSPLLSCFLSPYYLISSLLSFISQRIPHVFLASGTRSE